MVAINQALSFWQLASAIICLVWYIAVILVCSLGYLRMRLSFNRVPQLPSENDETVPFVSILRPIKGWDISLVECLRSTCLIHYPRNRFQMMLCVADENDPALPAIRQLMGDFPDVNMNLYVGDEDVGPNPKIRNLSRAYREAQGDIVWILDCNIWVPPSILRRSIRLLEGTDGSCGFKLVHHLPLVIDISRTSSSRFYRDGCSLPSLLSFMGGRLEESFMSSSHAKFYCAINTTGLAPCIVGKSNLFRRSHLYEATQGGTGPQRAGILYFAENICEDHLIGEILWTTSLREEVLGKRKWQRHGMASDLVFQPMDRMSLGEYFDRRVRWIRVRKFSVLAATLVEPMTESVVCTLMGSYALTTLSFFTSHFTSSWTTFWCAWSVGMVVWCIFDGLLFHFLHQYRTLSADENTPLYLRRKSARSLSSWAASWLGREILALPIWVWAMLPGPVVWREGRYHVRWKDMKVEEIRGRRMA